MPAGLNFGASDVMELWNLAGLSGSATAEQVTRTAQLTLSVRPELYLALFRWCVAWVNYERGILAAAAVGAQQKLLG
jgi:hypothetical protein